MLIHPRDPHAIGEIRFHTYRWRTSTGLGIDAVPRVLIPIPYTASIWDWEQRGLTGA